jgi:four helix bundle protein
LFQFSQNIGKGIDHVLIPDFIDSAEAKGSCVEMLTQLLIAQDLMLIESHSVSRLLQECAEKTAMLQSLINHLKKTQAAN